MRHSPLPPAAKYVKNKGFFVDFQDMNTIEDIYLTQRARDDLVTHVEKPIAVSMAAKPKFKPVGRVQCRKRKYKEAIDRPIAPGSETSVI